MKLKLLGCFVCLLIASWTSSAQAHITNLRYNPFPLYVDDPTIELTWTADRSLPRGYYYEAEINISTPFRNQCTNIAEGTSANAIKRGHQVRINISRITISEWCNGRVVLSLSYKKETKSFDCKEVKKEELNAENVEETEFEKVCKEKAYPVHRIYEGEFRILSKP